MYAATGIFLVLAIATELLSGLLSLNAPSVGQLVGTILLAGFIATTSRTSSGTSAHWSPTVTASTPTTTDPSSSASDLLGAVSLILSLVVFGLT